MTYAPGVTAPAGLANGAFVEVHSAGPATAGAIVATSVTLDDRFGDAAEVELEGLVTSGTSTAFVVDGQQVATSGSTRWQLGVPGDLVAGVKVEVEGHVDASGVLAADRVAFRAVVRLQGPASAVAQTGLLSASFTLVGLPVTLSEVSDWRDGLSPASLGGTIVELRGSPDRAGTGVTGTRVGTRNDTRLILQGGVSAKDAAAGTLALLGLTVATTGSTSYRDSTEAHAAMTKDAFFAAVEAGRTVVKSRGHDAAALAGTTLTAEELELEGDE